MSTTNLHDSMHLRREAQIQQPVRLVQHQHLNAVKLERLSVL
jgi:hypothetical protein